MALRWTLCLCLLSAICGCGPARPRPRVVADVLLPGDELRLTLASFVDDADHVPRVEAAWVRAAGEVRPVDWQPIDSADDDPLTSQAIRVHLPSDRKRLRLTLRVGHGPQTFLVTMRLWREPAGSRFRWRRGMESVRPLALP